MTPEQLAAIKARADAATPGPWETDRDRFDEDEGFVWVIQNANLSEVGQGLWAYVFEDACNNPENNAAFIAHARQDIDDLIAALEATQAEVAALHRMMESPEWQAQMAKSIAFFEAGFKGKTLDEIDEQQRVIRDLRAEVAEHEELFEATWAATTRGIAMWRAAHPGKELHMPDMASHTMWLMEQLDERDQRIGEWRSRALAILGPRGSTIIMEDDEYTLLCEIAGEPQ